MTLTNVDERWGDEAMGRRSDRPTGPYPSVGSRFAHAARAAPEWSPAIKALLRKRRFWGPEPPEALGGHFAFGASAAPEWSPAIKVF